VPLAEGLGIRDWGLEVASGQWSVWRRGLASLVFFAFVARNWKYSAFTAFVLAVLPYSLFLR
jgi:hypothetical protein